jgi:Serine carboxypeptidase S28
LGPAASNLDKASFATSLEVIFVYFQSHGVEGPEGKQSLLRGFCDWISTDPETNELSDARGWAAVKGANFTVDRWANLYSSNLSKRGVMNDDGSPIENAILINRKESLGFHNYRRRANRLDPDTISWRWQRCAELGGWETSNLGPHQLISKFVDLESYRQACHRWFPDGRSTGFLPEWPNVEAVRALGGWDIRPTNVFWIGDEFDPWGTRSPFSDSPESPHYKVVNNVSHCGIRHTSDAGLDGSAVFGYLVPGGLHGWDFHMDFAASVPAQKLFGDALKQWLQCWKPGQLEMWKDAFPDFIPAGTNMSALGSANATRYVATVTVTPTPRPDDGATSYVATVTATATSRDDSWWLGNGSLRSSSGPNLSLVALALCALAVYASGGW